MYLNFDVKRNTYNSKSIQVKVKFFPTTVALCTFNKIKKTRGLYLIGVKRYNAPKKALYITRPLYIYREYEIAVYCSNS